MSWGYDPRPSGGGRVSPHRGRPRRASPFSQNKYDARALARDDDAELTESANSGQKARAPPFSVAADILLDIFSRYVVGWMVASRESTALARQLIEDSCRKERVAPGELILHSDRGSPMTSQGTAQLLARLGVTRSLSRPQVSDDNPFSEAHFKTLKYHPGFPERFGSMEHTLSFARSFIPWYNTEHRHGGLSMLTPEQVHRGRATSVLDQRRKVLAAAFEIYPERFVRGRPAPRPLPEAVWINRPQQQNPSQGEGH